MVSAHELVAIAGEGGKRDRELTEWGKCKCHRSGVGSMFGRGAYADSLNWLVQLTK